MKAEKEPRKRDSELNHLGNKVQILNVSKTPVEIHLVGSQLEVVRVQHDLCGLCKIVGGEG